MLRLLRVLRPGAALALALATGGACEDPGTLAPSADAGSTPLEAQPPAVVPPASRVNASSSSVAFDPVRGGVWTANGDVGTISYVDPAARKVVQELPVGQDIRSIALSPDGAWIAAIDRLGASVTLVDAATRAVRRTIPLGAHPRACVWDATDPRWLYVAEEDDGAIAVVDRTAGALAQTVTVGRMPAGLAVSATRRELYVTHRIDPYVTVVDVQDRKVVADIALADEPRSRATVPNGKPTGFESLAVTTGGARAWTPHEILAPTHPFVFNETLFPAISVVDLVNRIEQQTDPNAGRTIDGVKGLIAGRKNLFDAISIIGPNGQPDVFSQPCAVAMHPNGAVAWALMCGSEDLLTFDVPWGMATSAIRGLPCDHPSGMTLDDTGARIFVLCDQSKQLLTLDTAGGSPVAQTTIYGDPIDVAVDAVAKSDPELRAGLRLFFLANSSKGALATTGNNWISCGGCHLDGFGPTNKKLFEALSPAVEIGHVGLTDQFSTASTPTDPSFDPHDILVALLDQGGLARDRAGQIDPSHPTADAALMAQRLARVVARDLPLGPSWMQPTDIASGPAFDGAWCGSCHPTQYAAWAKGAHAHSADDPAVVYDLKVTLGNPAVNVSRFCAGCHDPTSARLGEFTFTARRGVTCLACHDVDQPSRAGGNGDLVVRGHDWTAEHKQRGLASLVPLRQPDFCGGCHSQFLPGIGLIDDRTLQEYEASPFVGKKTCVDCHMPRTGSVTDHRIPGGNVPLAARFGDDALVAAQSQILAQALTLEASRAPGSVAITLRNAVFQNLRLGNGHGFPSAANDLREPWVEVQALDAHENVLARFGGPGPDGTLPPSAVRLNLAVVPPGAPLAVSVPLPSTLPGGTAELNAVLYYRSFNTYFWRSMTGDPSGNAPAIEVARVVVP